MTEPLKMMCILAHPDDESMGTGGVLAKYADEGIQTHLITATGGGKGWFGPEEEYPGPEELARIRGEELQDAANVLGLHEVTQLDYRDGELDQADPGKVIQQLVFHLRRVRPQVVVTFDPNGAYGHPDHIAICQLTTAAVVAAADPTYAVRGSDRPQRAAKLYYFVETEASLQAYEEAFGELTMQINGQTRRIVGWEPWAITTRVDTEPYWRQVWEAISCHRSQLPGYQALMDLPEEQRKDLFSRQSFYRAFSLVNGGPQQETDFFSGLR